MSFLDVIAGISDWLWGIPILIVLVGGGIIIMILTRGFQFTRAGLIWRNTIGTIFDKDARAKQKEEGGISPLQTFFAALGSTVGTGNIVGVGAALAIGGPGAMFWMWLCGILAMGIKYAEVLLSLQYRERNDEDEGYIGGAYNYIRKGLGSKPLAAVFVVLFCICNMFTSSVHTSSMCTSAQTLGVPEIITAVITIILLVLIIMGGLKGLIRITDKVVPFMSILYILAAMILIILNIGKVPSCIAMIFHDAFTGTAAVGGFGGAALAATIKTGLARGVFSNDAGLGATAFLMTQTEDVKHPAETAAWSVIETFVDTILICTLTGLMIMLTGMWTTGDDGSGMSAMALEATYGFAGKVICCVALVLFGFTTLIASLQANRVAAESLIKSKWAGIIAEGMCIVFVIVGYIVDLTSAFIFVDFGNVLMLILNMCCMIALYKDIVRGTDEWFFHPTEEIKKLQK